MRRPVLFIVLALLTAAAAPGQALDGLLDEYLVRTFGQRDGMPVSDVRGLVQVADGPILVATARGVVGFDGYGLRPVPLPGFESAVIDRLHEDQNGRVWVVSREREVGYLADERFVDLGRFPRLDPPNHLNLYETRDGAVWLAAGDGVYRAGPGTRPALTYRPGLGSVARGRTVRRNGVLVAGPPPSGAVPLDSLHLEPGAFMLVRGALGERLHDALGPAQRRAMHAAGVQPTMRPFAVLRGDADTYWIIYAAHLNTVSSLVHVRGDQWRVFGLREHLNFREIIFLLRDHEGSVWVGTDVGLVQLAPRKVYALRRDAPLGQVFVAPVLQASDGALWVGTWGRGLFRFEDDHVTHHFTAVDGLPDDRVRALHQAQDGSMWVGTKGGLVQIREGRIVRSEPLVRGEVRGFAEDTAGRLWIGTDIALASYTPSAGLILHDASFWDGRSIWAVHLDRAGTLWVGSEDGLFRIRDGTREAIGPAHGMRSRFVAAIHEEADGTLWFSTYEDGLYRYQGGRFVAVTMAEGLHHDGIWRMLFDDGGGVWMSSDGGLARVDRARLHAVADAIERGEQPAALLDPLVFTEAEGMPSRESNRASPGGWRLRDGRLVFNNIRGLVVVDPVRALRAPPPPRTLIQGLAADGRAVALGADAALAPGTRQVTVSFAALSFLAPQHNRYRYRIEGYDDAWIEAGTQPSVTVTGLPPGRYTFHVQGAGGTSPWGPPARLAFTIRPFAWETGWFHLAAVLLVAALLGALYRYRVGRLLAMERLRLRIASDLHDDVGSNLSSIALLSEMLGDRPNLDPTGRRQLARINAAAEETVAALREIIWLVNPRHTTLPALVRKMRRVARDLLPGTAWTLDVATPLPDRPLDLAFMRGVYLVYKEAVHNVAKHADARTVAIEVWAERGRFELRVRDDGRGFHLAAADEGTGLGSMARRAEALGGTLAVDSWPGEGTCVTLVVRMA